MTVTAPYRLTPDEESWARAAFCWALIHDDARLVECLNELNDDARREVACAADRLLRDLLPDEVVTHG